MSNVLSIIRSNHIQYTQKIIRCSTTLSQKITELKEYYQDNNEIQVKELRKIFKRIMKGHCPLNQFILDLYGISKEEMIKSIFCERCNKCPLKRIHGRWKCDYCSWTSKDAHKRALVDYYLLYGEEITSRELQEFLLIRILKDLKVSKKEV
jgi:hypothetical protein